MVKCDEGIADDMAFANSVRAELANVSNSDLHGRSASLLLTNENTSALFSLFLNRASEGLHHIPPLAS
jgi:hypothetical protein